MKNKVVNSRIRCLIAFCIPVLIICICFICLGITPFGDKTVLIWDAKLQHKDYYGYLWDVLHGKASLQYSAGKSLGGRMIGIIGFYIGSPLNIVLYFFKKTQIAEFMDVSINTVKFHIKNIYTKLNARSRQQALRIAKENKLITLR